MYFLNCFIYTNPHAHLFYLQVAYAIPASLCLLIAIKPHVTGMWALWINRDPSMTFAYFPIK